MTRKKDPELSLFFGQVNIVKYKKNESRNYIDINNLTDNKLS